MAWNSTEQHVVAQRIDEVAESALMPVGSIIRARDPDFGEGEFIYLKGVADTTAGTVVIYNTADFTTTIAPDTANQARPVAVAMAATVADRWGWYQIGGVATVKKNPNNMGPNIALYLSTTIGKVRSTAAAGKQLLGARSANAASVLASIGTIAVSMNRPHLQGQTS